MNSNNDDSRNTEAYADLGTLPWQEALERAYSPGIDTVAFDPDMFRKSGMTRVIARHKTMDKVTVIYDRQYVYYRLFNIFVKKLGVMHEGVFNDELYALLMAGLKNYALDEQRRENDSRIRDAAKALDGKIPGKGVDYWYEVIKAQQQEQNDEPEAIISINENESSEITTVQDNTEESSTEHDAIENTAGENTPSSDKRRTGRPPKTTA